MLTLKEKLTEWTDFDVAAHELALVLGVFSPTQTFQTELKHIYWSNNPLGNSLYDILEYLVDQKLLIKDEDEIKFKWDKEREN